MSVYRGYLPWSGRGEPTFQLSGEMGTHLVWGVPTLDGGYLPWMGWGTYLGQGYLPWTGCLPLMGGCLPWLGIPTWTGVPPLANTGWGIPSLGKLIAEEFLIQGGRYATLVHPRELSCFRWFCNVNIIRFLALKVPKISHWMLTFSSVILRKYFLTIIRITSVSEQCTWNGFTTKPTPVLCECYYCTMVSYYEQYLFHRQHDVWSFLRHHQTSQGSFV